MNAPEGFFEDGVPDREWVLSQTIEFDPTYRKVRLPDLRMWPPELDECPPYGKHHGVDRRRVFTIADRAVATPEDPWSATHLLVAAVLWGTGTRPRNATLRLRCLHDEATPSKLTAAIKNVRQSGAVSGYQSMQWGGANKINDVGPSFFTKFLYFAGWDSKPYLWQPLIMDDYVLRALNRVTGAKWAEGASDDYGRYLDLAKDWAFELGTSEDAIERRLFQMGGRKSR